MKALIIDDERMARQELRQLLAARAEIEIAGEARTGEEALGLIARFEPDVLFLDIRMPGMNGFDLLQHLDDVPQMIFTTAYDEYALKAFEVSALDYLVKPVVPTGLAAAIAKLRPSSSSRLEQVFVKDGEQCWLVRVADIFPLESEGNYTRLYFANERPLILRSLAALQERLDPAVFLRVGRRHVINLKWVKRVEPVSAEISWSGVVAERQWKCRGISRPVSGKR